MPHGRLLWTTVVAGVLAGASLAYAVDDVRYGTEYQTCARGSTVDIEQCVGRLTKAWDQRLNAAYQKLIKGNRNAYKMRIAQRLWVQFRNANCRYYGAGDGTIRRLHFAECMRSATAHRALELEDLLKGPGG
ncbi:MAG: lysozyme inhibitor LprI family protein [Xanthobacteraceae bacterium]